MRYEYANDPMRDLAARARGWVDEHGNAIWPLDDMKETRMDDWAKALAGINQGIDQLEAMVRDTVAPAVARMERALEDAGASEPLATMVAADYAGRLLDMAGIFYRDEEEL